MADAPNTSSSPTVEHFATTEEEKFDEIIRFLDGAYMLEKVKSRNKREGYFTIDLECTYNNFSYSASIHGDIFKSVQQARENVFFKASQVLRKRYYVELKVWSDARFEALKKTKQF